MRRRSLILPAIALAIAALSAGMTRADQIEVTVQNNQPTDGFYFTPVWAAFHDGSFDSFDVGGTASSSIEMVAEGGVLDGIIADFGASGTGQDNVIFGSAGFPGAPVFDPGEEASILFNVDGSSEQYFSFLSMVIPSNDAFVGNDDGMAYEIFDGAGNYNGDLVIEIMGNTIWDAGTEANDGQGAPFSAIGGTSTSEALSIRVHPGLDNFIGTDTAAGTTIGSGIGSNELLATITIRRVPEPTSAGLLLTGLVGLVARRRRS
ncbi:MAG: spondin domain-containing protein [Planctomycetota bacterium]